MRDCAPHPSGRLGAALGIGGVHSTARTRRTTEPAGREGTLVRGASHRGKGQEIGASLATPAMLRRLIEALYTLAKQAPHGPPARDATLRDSSSVSFSLASPVHARV